MHQVNCTSSLLQNRITIWLGPPFIQHETMALKSAASLALRLAHVTKLQSKPNSFHHICFPTLVIVPQLREWILPAAIAVLQLQQRLCYGSIGFFTQLL